MILLFMSLGIPRTVYRSDVMTGCDPPGMDSRYLGDTSSCLFPLLLLDHALVHPTSVSAKAITSTDFPHDNVRTMD
jgi:hypothetical protein